MLRNHSADDLSVLGCKPYILFVHSTKYPSGYFVALNS
jgi:hypothetical protein